LPIYILSTDEIPPEALALLGSDTPVAEEWPSEIMRRLLRIVSGAGTTLETWQLFAIESPDPKAVPIVAQAVREGFDRGDSFSLELGPGRAPVLTAQAAAVATGALLTVVALYRRDPAKTGEVLVPQPR
jgi:hypothetical protein